MIYIINHIEWIKENESENVSEDVWKAKKKKCAYNLEFTTKLLLKSIREPKSWNQCAQKRPFWMNDLMKYNLAYGFD